MAKVNNLIVYYSRTGNTQAVAQLIQQLVGGDLFAIQAKSAPIQDYEEQVRQNVLEQNENILPAIKTKITNFEDYQNIFLGAPTWNMALPQIVLTFLTQYDFANKIVIPFNTHGGFGSGASFTQIKQNVQAQQLLPGFSFEGGLEKRGIGLAIQGRKRQEANQKVQDWLRKLKLI